MGVPRLPEDPVTSAAVAAAVRLGAEHGYASEDPVVLQRTNNTVVWLRPHAVVAKTGTRAVNDERLAREHAVATALSGAGAPVAPPLAVPARDPQSGFLVTLWRRLEHDAEVDAAPADVATSLRLLHEHLARYGGEFPGFALALARARAAVGDDRLPGTLSGADRSLLRDTLDRGRAALLARSPVEQPLHGGPHRGNLLVTRAGLVWIDLEDVCRGPLEWDLAFLPESAVAGFGNVDHDLLALLRTLNSACVATWCALRPEYEELRWHHEHHLARVRASRVLCG